MCPKVLNTTVIPIQFKLHITPSETAFEILNYQNAILNVHFNNIGGLVGTNAEEHQVIAENGRYIHRFIFYAGSYDNEPTREIDLEIDGVRYQRTLSLLSDDENYNMVFGER